MNELRPRINHDNCTLCGKCVQICTTSNLEIRDKQVRVLNDCILCSQCYSVCRFDAVEIDALRPRSLKQFRYKETLSPAGKIKPADLIDLFASRRSVRKYTDREVPEDIISDLVECSVLAPSAHNDQQWEFVVVNGREKVASLAGDLVKFWSKLNGIVANPAFRAIASLFMGRKINTYYHETYAAIERKLKAAEIGNDMFLYNAPALIIIHTSMEGNAPLENSQYAAYNIFLLAHAMGLGTCFIGYASHVFNTRKALREKYGIPRSHGVHAVLTLGYPASKFVKPAMRKEFPVRWI